jgi:DNA-binding response OmpR family regulator
MAKILIVDDEPEIGELCASVLEGEGHDVDWTTNGEDALKRTKKTKYDLAIIDLVMPGIDGLEVVQKLRESFSNIGIIVFTGFASVDVAVKAMKGGADEFLTKPVWNDRLSESVANVLASRNGKHNSNMKRMPSTIRGKTTNGRNIHLLNGFEKEEAEDFLHLGHKKHHSEDTRIGIYQNDEIIIVLQGVGMLWNGDVPICKVYPGEAVGEARVFLANNGHERLYLEIESGTELIRINKDDLVTFFKDKEEKLIMRYAINVVNSQDLKLRHTFDEFGRLYRKMQSITAK